MKLINNIIFNFSRFKIYNIFLIIIENKRLYTFEVKEIKVTSHYNKLETISYSTVAVLHNGDIKNIENLKNRYIE